MEVFNKLSAVEDEVFAEMQKIETQISELKVKQTKLKDLAKVMNVDRLRSLKSKDAGKKENGEN
jgi:hypothetical protein